VAQNVVWAGVPMTVSLLHTEAERVKALQKLTKKICTEKIESFV
jgi:uncharacterized protein (DUF2252 family)